MTDADGREWIVVWEEGRRRLEGDAVFGPWVRAVGPVEVPVAGDDPFAYLARAICFQQLAGAAARTIHGRVVDVLDGRMEPEAVLETPEAELRAAGLSRSKLKAIRDLAAKVGDGEVFLDGLSTRSDGAVVEELTKVWGIGEWTAQRYLMFQLHRPDVWPVGDLGVRQGFARAVGMEEPPSAAELAPMGEPYRPWRSAVAFYCWRILETDLP